MRIYLTRTVILFFLFFILTLNVRAEEIISFDADIVINDDASVRVVETILYDFGDIQKHGIYRDIPVKYVSATRDNRDIAITDVTVQDSFGAPHEFAISREGRDLRIRIGDANEFVTGKRVYKIAYTVDGAINYFDEHEELYWNVTGDRWPVSISTVHATVRAPYIQEITCFAGVHGSSSSCAQFVKQDDTSALFIHEGIPVGSGMTFVVGMPVGSVYKPTIWEKIVGYLQDNWIVGVPFVVTFLMWRLWYAKGRDPEGKGAIIPQYEAPNGITAAEAGMIIEDGVQSKSISALIVQLAIEGYLIIKKIDKNGFFSSDDYEFIRTAKEESDIDNEQKKSLLQAIFKEKHQRRMSDMKNEFYKDFERIKENVVQSMMQKQYYTKNPVTVRISYIAIGSMLGFSSLFAGSALGLAYGFAIFFSAIPVIIFGILMPQRTYKGALLREEILGLKMYMITAEKDRIEFHNAPEKKPERFEKLLPYAMALGVEDQWARQFESIYKDSPEWYQANDSSFSSLMLAKNLHDFSNVTTSAMTSKPSSAGSGGSGFGGGGSGGGFGGGGGGSW